MTVSCSTEGQLGQKVKPNSVSVNADNIVIHNSVTKVVMVHTLQCETPSEQNDIDSFLRGLIAPSYVNIA